MAVNITSPSGLSTGGNYLAPWKIHKVTLKEVSFAHGQSDKGRTYHSLTFEFVNDEGSFSAALFCPIKGENNDEGLKRKRFGDNKYDSPSEEEKFIQMVIHMGNVVREEGKPNGAERIYNFYVGSGGRKGVDPIVDVNTFERFCKTVASLFSGVIANKTELQIKLISDKTGRYGRIPSCVGISKDGGIYLNNNFISLASAKPLTFTANELEMKERIEKNVKSGPDKVSDEGTEEIESVEESDSSYDIPEDKWGDI